MSRMHEVCAARPPISYNPAIASAFALVLPLCPPAYFSSAGAGLSQYQRVLSCSTCPAAP